MRGFMQISIDPGDVSSYWNVIDHACPSSAPDFWFRFMRMPDRCEVMGRPAARGGCSSRGVGVAGCLRNERPCMWTAAIAICFRLCLIAQLPLLLHQEQ